MCPRPTRSAFLSAMLAGVTAFASCCGPRAALAEEPKQDELPPIDAQFFYELGHPRLAQVEKSIAAVVREFPRLRILRYRLDEENSQRVLKQLAEKWNVQPRGEIILALGPFFLADRGEVREIESYFGPLVRRVLNPEAGKGRMEAAPAEFARRVFGADVSVQEVVAPSEKGIRYYLVQSGRTRLGYVVDVFRSVYCPLCSDAQFLAAVRPGDWAVLRVRAVRPLERYGKAMAPHEEEAITQRFVTGGDAQKKADAVTGATKTIRAYEDALQEVLRDLRDRYGQLSGPHPIVIRK